MWTTGAVARITPERYETTQVLGGDITTGSNYIKFSVTPNGSEQWEIDNDGKLQRK